MDLAIDCKKSIRFEKRTKQRIIAKKTVLSQNNYNEDFYSDEDFVKPKKSVVTNTKEKIVEEESQPVISDKSLKSTNLFEDILSLLTKKLNLSEDSDQIHSRYRRYLSLPPNQKDSTKTDYTYSHSFSYNRHLDLSKIFDWVVPNMSRKTISSIRGMTSTITTSSVSQSSNESKVKSETSSSSSSSGSPRSTRARTPTASTMFTRSQCLGGAKCEAPDCEIHKKRKRTNRTTGIVIPNSGPGLVPEFEFSDDDDCTANNRLNHQRLSTYQRNGIHLIDGTEEDDEEEEEITYFRKVTNIFRTTFNNSCSYVNSATPKPIKTVANKFPLFWFLAFCILLSSTLFWYVNNSKSSLWPGHSLDPITNAINDPSSKLMLTKMVEELKSLRRELISMKNSNEDLKLKFTDNEFNSKENWNHLSDRIDSIESYFNNYMKNCCKNETNTILALIDERLSSFMAQMLSDNQNNRHSFTPLEAAEELKKFILLELSKTNDNLRESVELKLMSTVERLEKQNIQSSSTQTSSSNVSIDEIKSLISQALAIYDADKTGQPDFALEPAGGTIINTRCSETYDPYGVQYRIFGMPVWSSSVSPRAVIQPTISPGECWAFKGTNGYLVIKLSQSITPTGFSYEHIPKQISRDGNIDSAPKEFQVRGLEDESDTKGHLLGNYVYEDNGRPMQYFEVQDPNPPVFQLIELVILSNHGHQEYTCLYRFRVHGKRVNH